MAINFNKLVDDFRRLNPRDPGTWPAIPKLTALTAVLVVLPVAAYFLDWQSQLAELDAGQQQEKKLKEDYVNKKRQAINLAFYSGLSHSEISAETGILRCAAHSSSSRSFSPSPKATVRSGVKPSRRARKSKLPPAARIREDDIDYWISSESDVLPGSIDAAEVIAAGARLPYDALVHLRLAPEKGPGAGAGH